MKTNNHLVPGPDPYGHLKARLLAVLCSSDFLLAFGLFLTGSLFVYLFHHLLAPFLVSLILAYILSPLVVQVMRLTRLQRTYAVLVVFLLLAFTVLAFLVPFSLQLAAGVNSMAQEVATIEYRPLFERLRENIVVLRDQKLPPALKSALDSPLESLKAYEDKVLEFIAGVRDWSGRALKSLGGTLLAFSNLAMKRTMDFMLIPVLLFYLLLDYHRLYALFVSIIPPGYRPWTKAFCEAGDKTLRSFLFGQFLVALIYGVLMTLGLLLIGIKFSLVIGPLSGIANLIPYLGVIFSLGPVLGLAVYQGVMGDGVLWMVSLVSLHYIIVQAIDGLVLQPRIIGENVELHPLIVMLALMIGGDIGGVYGMVFAVPVAALLKVLLSEFYSVLYEGQSRLLQAGVSEGNQ